MASKIQVECPKCCGNKYIEGVNHIANGVCFCCKGNGTILVSQATAKELGPTEYQSKRAEWIVNATDDQISRMTYEQLQAAREFCHSRVPGFGNLLEVWNSKAEQRFQEMGSAKYHEYMAQFSL